MWQWHFSQFSSFFSTNVFCTVLKWLPGVCLLWKKSPFKVPSTHKMASDSPMQSLLSYTHAHTHTFTVSYIGTLRAQWEVAAKRAAIVPVRVRVFSQEIYSCLNQPAPFLLNHYTMDMLIWSSTWDKSFKMCFLLYVVIWFWTARHTEVVTTQSPGISAVCTRLEH